MSHPKWNLVVDIDRCNNCNNCVLATKDEHVANDFPGYAAPQPLHGHHWIEMQRAEHGCAPIVDIVNVPTMCNHCDDAPCVRAGQGAVRKRADGIVLIAPEAARGRRDLVDACPYGAIWWNEERQLPQHWIFDAHLLDQGWKAPRCEQACPTEAIRSLRVTDDEMRRIVETEGLAVMRPELGTKPRVWYRGLHRYDRWMVGGSVSALQGGVDDCLAGAQVRLLQGERVVANAVTDDFGEFRLRHVPPQAADYRIEIGHTGYETRTVPVQLAASATLEHVVLRSTTA